MYRFILKRPREHESAPGLNPEEVSRVNYGKINSRSLVDASAERDRSSRRRRDVEIWTALYECDVEALRLALAAAKSYCSIATIMGRKALADPSFAQSVGALCCRSEWDLEEIPEDGCDEECDAAVARSDSTFLDGDWVQGLLTNFGSGVVSSAGSFKVHIPFRGMMPLKASPTFMSADRAAQFHDRVISGKDEYRSSPSRFLIEADQNALWQHAMTEYRQFCVARGLRLDQAYELHAASRKLRIRPEAPFHQSMDDVSSDIGPDHSGWHSYAVLGNAGALVNARTWVAMEQCVVDTIFSKGLGRGVRIVPLLGDRAPLYAKVLVALGIEPPSDDGGVLKIYCGPHNEKGISPLFENGVYSLCCCSKVCRQSCAKTFFRIGILRWTPTDTSRISPSVPKQYWCTTGRAKSSARASWSNWLCQHVLTKVRVA